MAIPKFKKKHIIEAMRYIDENSVPFHNQSTKYELVTEEGKRYPPKYVMAMAGRLANGTDISTNGFNAVEAKGYLEGQGFTIEEKHDLKIPVDSSDYATFATRMDVSERAFIQPLCRESNR